MDTELPSSGGRPRPSLIWQLWHERALNSGPNPSDASVDDGDDIHNLRKNPLPSLNCSSSLKDRFAEDCENAS